MLTSTTEPTRRRAPSRMPGLAFSHDHVAHRLRDLRVVASSLKYLGGRVVSRPSPSGIVLGDIRLHLVGRGRDAEEARAPPDRSPLPPACRRSGAERRSSSTSMPSPPRAQKRPVRGGISAARRPKARDHCESTAATQDALRQDPDGIRLEVARVPESVRVRSSAWSPPRRSPSCSPTARRGGCHGTRDRLHHGISARREGTAPPSRSPARPRRPGIARMPRARAYGRSTSIAQRAGRYPLVISIDGEPQELIGGGDRGRGLCAHRRAL